MTAALHSGNERWQVHCPDPHPDPGCWCFEEWDRLRHHLTEIVFDVGVTPSQAIMAANHLLTAGTLRIELR
jgi:hypothetical protein